NMACRNLAAALQYHADGPSVRNADPLDRSAGLQLYAGGRRGGGEGGGHRAHAALRLNQAVLPAGDVSGGAVEQIEHAVRGFGTEEAAENAVEGEDAFERVALEIVVEQVGGIHADDSRQFAHVAPPEPAQRQR